VLTQEIVTISARKEFVDQENQAEIVAPFMEMEEDAGPMEVEEPVPVVNIACMKEQSPVTFNEQVTSVVEEELDEIPDLAPQASHLSGTVTPTTNGILMTSRANYQSRVSGSVTPNSELNEDEQGKRLGKRVRFTQLALSDEEKKVNKKYKEQDGIQMSK